MSNENIFNAVKNHNFERVKKFIEEENLNINIQDWVC